MSNRLNLLFFRGIILLLFSIVLTTAVAKNESPLTRFAFGSCAKEDRPQPIWDQILQNEPELFIWLGDNIYGDTLDPEVLREKYGKLRSQPGYSELLDRDTPVLATWDDHDFGENDAGAEYPMKEESKRIFLEFFGVEETSERWNRDGVYHSEIFGPVGQRTQIILLDTRFNRSPLERFQASQGERAAYKPNTDEGATFLGENQWKWLEEQLRKPAEVRFIASSIQFVASEHIYEKWSNIPQEIRRMLNLISETKAQGVIFLSGDRHHAELSKLEVDDGYPIYDLTSSGINQSRPRSPDDSRPIEKNRSRLGRVFRGHHFGQVEIHWEQPDPLIRLSIINQEGEQPISHSLLLSEISANAELNVQGTWVGKNESKAIVHPQIAIDGRTDDWKSAEPAISTDESILLRFSSGDERTVRRHYESIEVLFDLDGEDSGQSFGGERGYDLEVVLSPNRDEKTLSRWGPKVVLHTPAEKPIDAAEVGLAVAPTHSSRWFELAIDRTTPLVKQQLAANEDNNVRIRVSARDRYTSSERLILSDTIKLVPASEDISREFNLPSKPSNAIRVAAINVLWGTQLRSPEAFSRMFKAINADVWLLQEWDRNLYTEYEIESWFSKWVDEASSWESMVSGAQGSWSGTAIVSRYPVRTRVPEFTPLAAGGWSFPVRFAGAGIETPYGNVLAASVHLKAGGSFRSNEDTRRKGEVDAINRILVGAKAAIQPDAVIFGGDFNMNGTTEIMKTAFRMLDVDNSDLTLADAAVLGREDEFYTHGRSGLRNRLDYIAYSDASSEVINAFVLDTALFEEAQLRPFGLQKEDSNATDHLPVVVDLILTNQKK